MFVISTKDIDTRDYIHISMIFFEVQNVFDHHSIGFSLSSLCNTLSFLCDTMTQTFGSRENCREQFNIYHGGIIKVQSSKKRLVRFATISIPRFLPNGEGPSRIRLDFEAFPLMYPVFPLFFLRLILIASSASFSISCLSSILVNISFRRNHREEKNYFLSVAWKIFKIFKIRRTHVSSLKVLFFFNFQRDRRERGEKREKIVRGMWWHSSSSLDDKRFTTRRDSKRRHFNEIIM